ncbi:MAG TPA: M20 family metallopeptidase [Actinomycetota bacterium]|jgi:acetylornithine deacetylase/succinyl-diaminopimelate desuccinylase family protein
MSPSVADIRRLVDRDRLVERLRTLVRTPSENPPGEEAAAAEVAARYCTELGLDVSTAAAEPDRPSVIARWEGGAGPTLGFCSHIDVVPAGDPGLWELDPYGADIVDGRMYGRGSSDAKGPIAAALEAVAVLRAANVELGGCLELELVSDEEAMGFKGAGYLVEQGIVRPDFAIVGEPTSLRVVRAQRGACWFRIIARGVAGHGSAPERGVNAIKHMAEIVSHLEETVPDISHPVLGGPSINVGTIRGGEKVNVIPASCIVEVDRRSIPQESKEDVEASVAAALDKARERYPDLDATVEMAFYGKPFEMDENASVVGASASAVADATGAEAELVGFRGASDARFLAEAGAEVVVLGPGDITLAHTARESIDIDELERGTVAYALAFARLLAPA